MTEERKTYERLYVIASLHKFGHNRHGWLMPDGSINDHEEGCRSFLTIEEAEAKIAETVPKIRQPHIVRFA
jgi:hypothetical protein